MPGCSRSIRCLDRQIGLVQRVWRRCLDPRRRRRPARLQDEGRVVIWSDRGAQRIHERCSAARGRGGRLASCHPRQAERSSMTGSRPWALRRRPGLPEAAARDRRELPGASHRPWSPAWAWRSSVAVPRVAGQLPSAESHDQRLRAGGQSLALGRPRRQQSVGPLRHEIAVEGHLPAGILVAALPPVEAMRVEKNEVL